MIEDVNVWRMETYQARKRIVALEAQVDALTSVVAEVRESHPSSHEEFVGWSCSICDALTSYDEAMEDEVRRPKSEEKP